LYILIAISIFITSIIGIFLPKALIYIAIISLLSITILALKAKNQTNQTYKELEKIKKKRKKTENKKHKLITQQLNYIQKNWGYTKAQTKTVEQLLELKAYKSIYQKLTISILPQLIELIDNCHQKEQKGCKQSVNRKINELTSILKDAIKKDKEYKKENYEISLEVLEKLMKEVKR